MFFDYKMLIHNSKIIKSIGLIITIWIVWMIIQQIMSLIFNDYSKPVNSPNISHVPITKVSLNLQTPFFGDYVPQNLEEGNVKRSMLNLTVVGIVFSKHEKDSEVIIRLAGGQEKTFKVNDLLPGGATIKRITPAGVLIIRNGSLESLSLPRNELIFEPPPKPLQ